MSFSTGVSTGVEYMLLSYVGNKKLKLRSSSICLQLCRRCGLLQLSAVLTTSATVQAHDRASSETDPNHTASAYIQMISITNIRHIYKQPTIAPSLDI